MEKISLQKLKKSFATKLSNIYSETEAKPVFIWLIEHYFNATSIDLLMDKSLSVSADTLSKYQNALNRLKEGEPVQYILGYTEFYNCHIKVDNNVLIPRPETEVLVDWIVSDMDQLKPGKTLSILDLGTGSGCMAIALAKHLNYPVKAIDISPEAIQLAKENANLNQVSVDFKTLDMNRLDDADDVPDILVSNPPYVLETEKNQMENKVVDYEPHLALFSKDPLYFYHLIFRYVQQHQKIRYVYLELNHLTADAVADLFRSIDHQVCTIRKDMRGNKRFLKWHR